MTQSVVEEIKKKLTQSSWTPGKKDVSILLENWLAFSEEEREELEKSLAKLDAQAVDRATNLWNNIHVRIRGDWARPLARAIVKNQQETSLEWLAQMVNHESDPRARKGFIQAVGGGLQGKELKKRSILVDAILAASARRDLHLPEVKALTEALGKSADPRAVNALKLLAGQGGEVGRSQLILERDTARANENDDVTIDLATLMDGEKGTAKDLVFWFVPGLEKLALRTGVFGSADTLSQGVLLVESGLGKTLRDNLLWQEVGVVLGRVPANSAEAVAKVVARSSPRLRASMKGLKADAKIRLRIDQSGEENGPKIGAWAFAEALAKENCDIMNDGRNAHWQVRLLQHGTNHLVVAVSKKHVDARWTWRGSQDIEGSSQSTVAAGIVALAAPRANDTIWDPFCGAGTELVIASRVTSGKAKLFGTDVNPNAIEAAKRKAAELGIAMELRHCDALTISERFSTIVTNPPFGMRTSRGEARGILEELFRRIRARLGNGGRFVLLSHAPAATADWGKNAGLRLVESIPVKLGGISCELQRFE